jgi:F-type H+-transporting ATPase subunit delta
MEELIAKRYVKALVSISKESIEEYSNILGEIALAFQIPKFRNIIESPEVSKADKTDIVISSMKKTDDKIKNFIKLLGENSRLDLIEAIAKELQYQLALKKNEFQGKIISSKKLSQGQVSKLESSFSEKLKCNIVLSQENSNYDGVKVEIDDLGIEIGFSKERLQAQIIEHILKAI